MAKTDDVRNDNNSSESFRSDSAIRSVVRRLLFAGERLTRDVISRSKALNIFIDLEPSGFGYSRQRPEKSLLNGRCIGGQMERLVLCGFVGDHRRAVADQLRKGTQRGGL